MTNSRLRQWQRTALGASLAIPPAVILTAPIYTEFSFEHALALAGPYLGLVGILVKSLWGGSRQDEREPEGENDNA